MPRTSSTTPILLRRGINDVIDLFLENEPYDFKGYTDTVENRELFYRIFATSSLPPATAFDESTGINYEDFSTPFSPQDVQVVQRGIGFSVTRLAMERDYYGKIANIKGTAMARSLMQAMDADAANFFNLGTTTSVTTMDGIALFSASHIAASGFTSNIISGNPALSAQGLEAGIAALQTMNDYLGQPYYIDGPYTLVVAGGLRGLANRLVTAQGYPGTPNNDPNWAGGYVNRIITLRRATFTTGWALMANGGPEANPLHILSGTDTWVDTQYDMDKAAHKYATSKAWKKFASKPYGIVWSAGTNV